MSQILQRAEAEISKRKLLSRGQKILVAVSGGVDSMVLLDLLHSLANKNHWTISVAHFNHRLRGRASAADERLVRRTAARLRLKFFAGGADVNAVAARAKVSVEMAARKLRHEFLARTAREQKISTITLAHHADDQVELFFLRLLRGAGGEGLAGMKWRSPSPADKAISLVRPLLDFSKAELLKFARENKTRFREDATNDSTDFLRNRIRNELLPLLRKKYQPAVDKTVLRLMDIVGAEAEFVSETAQRWLRGVPATGAVLRALAESSDVLPGFQKLPPAVQRKILQQQLAAFGLLPDFELIEQLRETPGKWVDVGPGLSVARDAAGEVCCREHAPNQFNPAEHELKLSGRAGRVEFGGRKFHWQIQAQTKFQLPPKRRVGQPPASREFFDADKIGGDILLRHWRAGDRFQPIGLRSAAKLQDLFVNAKIPAARRRDLVLATTIKDGIFWVEGLRIAEKFKLTRQTSRKLLWKWSKLPA